MPALDLIMFVVEGVSGIKAGSNALLGDSLDMFDDALAYGSSLYVLRSGLVSKAKSARFKGSIMLFTGAAIFGRTIYRPLQPGLHDVAVMAWIALLALAANITCLLLLWHHRGDDVNMSQYGSALERVLSSIFQS